MRPDIDVSKVVFVAIDDSGIIQGSGINRLCCGASFLSEAYIRATPRAKLKVEPTSRIINGAIMGEVTRGQFEVRLLPFRDHRKGRAGSPLAPVAVTNNDNIRVANDLLSDVTADATAFECRSTHKIGSF